MRYLITGGTGFIGKYLVDHLIAEKHSVVILTRNPKKVRPECEAITDLSIISSKEKFDVIVNLAGANISQRWTKSYKKILLQSRIEVTQGLVDLVSRLEKKPELFISASAIGYYGDISEDICIDENTIAVEGFTHDLCQKWEDTANKMKDCGVRTCIVRLGVVLGKGGGALEKMLPPFYIGFGGKIGDGKQNFSWVHIKDVISTFSYFVENNVEGVFNLTAPYPVTNQELTKTIGSVLNRPTFFDLPAPVIKIIFGEMGQNLLLKGNKVVPKQLQSNGFDFKYTTIDSALEDILEKK